MSIGSNTHVVWGSLNLFCKNGWRQNWELMEYRITAEAEEVTRSCP